MQSPVNGAAVEMTPRSGVARGIKTDGFALIAVLVTISVLLAIATPFVLSMGRGRTAAAFAVRELQAESASVSARDAMLTQAQDTTYGVDSTPVVDGVDEFPQSFSVPDRLAIGDPDEGETLLISGSVEDTQRFFHLDSATPLVLANLLGLSVRVAEEFTPDASELAVDGSLDAFSDSGFLLLGAEVIHYDQIDEGRFQGIERGLFAELGFSPGPNAEEETAVPVGALVLDYRCVAAILYPHLRDGDRSTRQPYGSVRELSRISELGVDTFSEEELDHLERFVTTAGLRESSDRFGRESRVFGIFARSETEPQKSLLVRGTLSLGSGRVVRLRSQDGELQEYALVARAVNGGGGNDYQLPTTGSLTLLMPLLQPFQDAETFVEPISPVPVNLNTASPEVLAALFQHIRRAPAGLVVQQGDRNSEGTPFVSEREASSMASSITLLRGGGLGGDSGEDGGFQSEELLEVLRETMPEDLFSELESVAEFRPFTGFEDLFQRALPIFLPSSSDRISQADRGLVFALWETMHFGCPGSVEMGTAPIVFQSAPSVRFRSAASLLLPSGEEAARSERTGTALTVPGQPLTYGAADQRGLEEFARLDRQYPWWVFGPNNTHAQTRETLLPASPVNGHLASTLFPGLQLGQPRFPGTGGDDAWVQPLTATTPQQHPNQIQTNEAFWTALDPEGKDLGAEGTHSIINIGPRGQGDVADVARGQTAFPFTMAQGLTRNFACQFWFRLDDTGNQTLFEVIDPSVGPAERSRVHLSLRDQNLVFEVVGEGGIDPQPDAAQTAPLRSAGLIQVPLTDLPIEADRWYHASLSGVGDRPGQLSLLVDGVPRGNAAGRTYLTQALASWAPDFGRIDFRTDSSRFGQIQVENTDGFPERGVLRIGRELIEYSSRDGSNFYLDYRDGMGGRACRANIGFFSQLDLSNIADPQTARELAGEVDIEASSPEHPVGAAVELYGYSMPVYPNRFLQPGELRLQDGLGAFAVARVANQQGLDDIFVQRGNQFDLIGQGFRPETNIASIELSDPVSADMPAPAASERISSAFPSSGGFALLVQLPAAYTAQPRPGQPGDFGAARPPLPIGGMEVISYGSRAGNRLNGIQRSVTLNGLRGQVRAGDLRFPNGAEPRTFVVDWDEAQFLNIRDQPRDLIPTSYLMVLPISIPVSGSVSQDIELVNWLQITPDDRSQTEWVRYDTVLSNDVVRADTQAFQNVMTALFGPGALDITQVQFVTDQMVIDSLYPDTPWPVFDQSLGDVSIGVGYIDQLEFDFPACGAARRALKFRGDDLSDITESDSRIVGTSSHPQNAGTRVLPVHRMEYSSGQLGLSAPRAGHGDRVALIQGTARTSGNPPTAEWHTVRWAARTIATDVVDGQTGELSAQPRWGPFQSTLVAFEAPVRARYLGLTDPFPFDENLNDPRLLDRMVKYPSGEMPVADVDEATLGPSDGGLGNPTNATVDELALTVRHVDPRPLDQNVQEDALEFFVRPLVTITAAGDLGSVRTVDGNMVERRPRQWDELADRRFPQNGGMLQVDGELIVYESFDANTGRVVVPQGGRGVLGTEPRGHSEGAIAHFLEHHPATQLTSGASRNEDELQILNLGTLPRSGGTLLIDQELVHYTWIRAGNLLCMPRWYDPANEDAASEGLFRGRYGTAPNAHSAGAPVLWFPQRYWDRYHERADDPELAKLQITLDHGPAWFDGFLWNEQNDDELVDIRALVRIDDTAGWDADPEDDPNLWFFEDGAPDDEPNPIEQYGQKFQARLMHVFRPGAFDPVTFLAQGWKRAPRLKWWLLRYEGEPRVLTEEVRTR
ncbi:MAG: hypothetical protein AAF196_05030 [Planctomycetota bacterium]